MVTNSPVGVHDFAAAVGGPLAGKNLSAASLVESSHIQTAYTRRLEPADLADLSGVETTAHLFQQFIDNKSFEVRATVVGERVFAAAIRAGSDAARIDFRADYPSLDYSVVEPPATVRDGMLAFLRAFDLSFWCVRLRRHHHRRVDHVRVQPVRGLRLARRHAEPPDYLGPGRSPRIRSPRMSYPTDLSPEEQRQARARLAELAEQFTAKAILRTPVWREVFERTWRHPYVPSYYPDKDAPCVLSVDPVQRGGWLETVYSDTTLITKIMPVPLSRALRPATGTIYTSSSTAPSLVLEMLEELDITDGHRVLEVGTGTGYNAALLCARLGSTQITSVDIDPELVDLAEERLAANGHTPTLAAVDGEDGYLPGAPHDRIISTCAVPAIPPAWLEQAAPGAVILTDVHGPLGGTLARLTVDEHGAAVGRFVPRWAGFMTMRHAVNQVETFRPWVCEPSSESVTSIDPAPLAMHGLFGFIVQWHLPDVTRAHTVSDDGQPVVDLVADDGSRAEITMTRGPAGYRVRQYGPQRLWDRVEEAATFWNDEGRPSYERFGITATPHGQHVWYDDPDGPRRWPLEGSLTR